MARSNVVYETIENYPMKVLNNESNQKDIIKNKNPPFHSKETATNNFVQLLSNSRNECTHFANANTCEMQMITHLVLSIIELEAILGVTWDFNVSMIEK